MKQRRTPSGKRRRKQGWTFKQVLLVLLVCAVGMAVRYFQAQQGQGQPHQEQQYQDLYIGQPASGEPSPGEQSAVSLADIPEYSGSTYVEINGNIPGFTEEDLTEEPFETYSPLDALGRCGPAYANICRELMPTEKREDIHMVHPTGWHASRYDFVDGESLYNRSHLIGFQLAGENANEKNLITGTRYMNAEGMLPFENLVADYVKETGNHVLYRVTPVFQGTELVARGVQMEAMSVEDRGEGVLYNVYLYNVQPGVGIDYATGDNWPLEEEEAA